MGGVIAMVITLTMTSSPAVALNYVACPTGGGDCFGTNEDDYIWGSANADTIYGKGGNDIIMGNAGNDVIHGDGCINTGCEGADIIHGGAGNDIIHHDGNYNWHNQQDYNADKISCGSGTDTVYYKPSGDNDKLYSNHGCETINTANS